MALEIRLAYDDGAVIRELFTEYTDMLVENDPAFAGYLAIQNYDAEVADLRSKYGLPDGRIYLALVDGRPAGCIAVHRIDADSCELKRLYVRPEFRGHGLAQTLTERILSDARKIGYRTVLLDTLPFLTAALRLYKKLGFYEVPSYNNSPLAETIYLRLDLEARV
jgi:GNAT superfamily N-acetyltransferase